MTSKQQSTKLKGFLSNVLVMLLSLLLVLLVAEGLIRALGYEGEEERLNVEFDNVLGHVPKRMWIYRSPINPVPGGSVNIRGQKIAYEKDPARTRIIFIGDSGTWGAGVALEQTFPLIFREKLGQISPGTTEVLNAGVIGMTPVSEYKLLRDQIVKLKPDRVVLGFFMANDINFVLGHRQLLDASQTRGLLNMFKSHSALVHFAHLRMMVLNDKYKLFRFSAGKKKDLTRVPIGMVDEDGISLSSYPSGEVATYRQQYSPTMEYAFEVLEEVLHRFKDLAATEEFEFAVLLIPTSSTILQRLELFKAPGILAELQAGGVNISERNLDYDKPGQQVMAICNRLEIVCINPIERMRMIGSSAIIPRDDHPSVIGHRAMGEVLFQHYNPVTQQFQSAVVH